MPVITLVRFTPHIRREGAKDREYLRQALPLFEGVTGLNRKYLCATDTGGIGVYEWASEQDARSYYDDNWHTQMQTMATDITIEFLQVRAFIDNEAKIKKVF